VHGLVAYTDPSRHRIEAAPAMIEDILLPFSFPAVGRKKITAVFDGGRITSDESPEEAVTLSRRGDNAVDKQMKSSIGKQVGGGLYVYRRAIPLTDGIDPGAHDASRVSASAGMGACAPDQPRGYYVHAGIRPGVPLDQQTAETKLWIRDSFLRHKGPFPKYIVHGHTPTIYLDPQQTMPDVRDNRCNVDTGAGVNWPLSAAIFNDRQTKPIHTISTGAEN
jgi:hypothetical protein